MFKENTNHQVPLLTKMNYLSLSFSLSFVHTCNHYSISCLSIFCKETLNPSVIYSSPTQMLDCLPQTRISLQLKQCCTACRQNPNISLSCQQYWCFLRVGQWSTRTSPRCMLKSAVFLYNLSNIVRSNVSTHGDLGCAIWAASHSFVCRMSKRWQLSWLIPKYVHNYKLAMLGTFRSTVCFTSLSYIYIYMLSFINGVHMFNTLKKDHYRCLLSIILTDSCL